jgi:hypothetical protein
MLIRSYQAIAKYPMAMAMEGGAPATLMNSSAARTQMGSQELAPPDICAATSSTTLVMSE